MNLPKPSKSVSDFFITHGSYYLALDSSSGFEEICKELKKLLPIIEKQPKTRVIWDKNPDHKDLYNDLNLFFQANLEGFRTERYEPTFFDLKKKDLGDLKKFHPEVDWQSYISNFSYELLDPNIKENQELILDFSLHSFAVDFKSESRDFVPKVEKKIRDKFRASIVDPKLKNWLIKEQQTGLAVGLFGLVEVWEEELQLHSVAGLKSKPCYEGGKKLPMIMAATVDLFENSSFYTNLERLAFTNGKPKVTQKYLDLGFNRDRNREGLLVVEG